MRRTLPLLGACMSVCLACLACKRPDTTGGTLSESTAVNATAAPVPSPPVEARPVFAGSYHSTEGLATIVERGEQVTIEYPDGHADCKPSGKTLSCTWHEGQDYGGARLTQIQGRKLVGTWGVGKSETSGGTWEFVPATTP